jgi:hypothetical protein
MMESQENSRATGMIPGGAGTEAGLTRSEPCNRNLVREASSAVARRVGGVIYGAVADEPGLPRSLEASSVRSRS